MVAKALRALLNEEIFRFELNETNNERTTGKRPNNYSPIFLLCDGSDNNYAKAELVNLLLSRNADIEAQLDNGATPLLKAVSTGITDVARILAKAGANVFQSLHPKTNDDFGSPILQLAVNISTEMQKFV